MSTEDDGNPVSVLGPMPFAEHKEATAKDCETIAEELQRLAAACREGDMDAFERMWWSGGTEEGDARISSLRELIVLRYLHRQERVANTKTTEDPNET